MYYIGVSSEGNDSYNPVTGTGAIGGATIGDFRLNVNIVNPDPNGVFSGAVPIDLATPPLFASFGTASDPTAHIQGYIDLVGTLGSDPPVTGSVNTNRVNVDNGDVDMFKMQAPDDGVLYINSNDTGESASEYPNPYVRVFRDNGNGTYTEVANTSGENAFATSSNLTVPTKLGFTYYVAISDYTNESYDPTSPYGRPTNSTPHAAPMTYSTTLVFDNGDQNGTAYTAVNEAVGNTISGGIGTDRNTFLYDTYSGTATFPNATFTKDVDWLSFPITQTGIFDLSVTNSSGFTPDLALWLYDSSTQQVVKIADSGGSGELSCPVATGWTIYTTISDIHNSGFDWNSIASGSGGAAGTYTLSSSYLSDSTFKVLNNDSIQDGTPTSLTLGKSINGDIGMDGTFVVGPTDVDLYSFQAPANGTVTLSTLTQNEANADTVVRVFDANGNALATSQSSAFTDPGGAVAIRVTAGQTYYVGISGVAGSAINYSAVDGSNAPSGSIGNYQLSSSFAIQTPSKLTFAQQPPASVIAGALIAPAIAVDVVDASGNVVTSNNSNVTLTILGGSNVTTVIGTQTVQAVNGVATFGNVSLIQSGNYTLRVSDSSLTTAVSTIAVVPDAASSRLVLLQQPGNVFWGQVLSPSIIVDVKDQFGNIVVGNQSQVSLSIVSGPGIFNGGQTAINVSNGSATFGNVLLSAAGTYTIDVTDSGFSGVVAIDETVMGLATTISIPHVSTSYALGKTVSFSATVATPALRKVPFPGVASVVDGHGDVLGNATVTTAGVAKFTLSNLLAGSYLCTLEYPGDTERGAANSGSFQLNISQATTRTTLKTSPSQIFSGGSLLLTASVAWSGAMPVGATGTVTFTEDGQVVGSVNLSGPSVNWTVSNLTAGSHLFAVSYSGDSNFKGSVSAVKKISVKVPKVLFVRDSFAGVLSDDDFRGDWGGHAS